MKALKEVAFEDAISDWLVEHGGRHVQLTKKQPFYIRLNNATEAIEKDDEVERYIAQRWGG